MLLFELSTYVLLRMLDKMWRYKYYTAGDIFKFLLSKRFHNIVGYQVMYFVHSKIVSNFI